MEFVWTIDLTTMNAKEQIAEALRHTADWLDAEETAAFVQPTRPVNIVDRDGNTVGSWAVI